MYFILELTDWSPHLTSENVPLKNSKDFDQEHQIRSNIFNTEQELIN